MKKIHLLLVGTLLLAFLSGCSMQHNEPEPIRAMVLTGGHGYDQPEFKELFNSLNTIQVTYDTLDKDGTFFDDISDWQYDVIVFYHFRMPISETSQANLMKLTDNGVGLVVLHHAIAGFNEWTQWREIVGATYFLEDTTEDGSLWKRCTYQHDVEMPVVVASKRHPVTKRVDDFTILDETYKGYRLEGGNELLLTSDHELSQREIGWTRTFKNAPVCYIQLGHDKKAYANPSYRQLIEQAINWAAQN